MTKPRAVLTYVTGFVVFAALSAGTWAMLYERPAWGEWAPGFLGLGGLGTLLPIGSALYKPPSKKGFALAMGWLVVYWLVCLTSFMILRGAAENPV